MMPSRRSIWIRLVAYWRADRIRCAILLGVLVVQIAMAGWDLPSTFSWENDGVAPHDFAVGAAQDVAGPGFRYPLFHLLVLAIACAPVLVPAALSARSFAFADLRDAVITPATMTGCSIIAKLVTIAMGIVALIALGRIAEQLFSRRAARWTVFLAAANISVAYYTRTSNLDGPALMWTVLAVERLIAMSGAARGTGSRRDLIWFCVYSALAVATKDQAYAPILAVLPFAVMARGPRALIVPALIGAAVYLVASGAAINPSGFAGRVREMLGPASGDYRSYPADLGGALANLGDIVARQAELFWAWPIVALAWIGAVLDARGRALVPLVAGLGSLFALALVIGRNEHRFVLPLGFFLSLYAGRAADRFARSRIAAAAVAGFAITGPLSLAITQLGDARYRVEDWLVARVTAGAPSSTIETYGPLVYLPRFDLRLPRLAAGELRRIDTSPPAGRDPLPGMAEALGVPGDVAARRPGLIVLTEGFAGSYVRTADSPGQTLARNVRTAQTDRVTRAFVVDAIADRLPGYRLALAAAPPEFPTWGQVIGLAPVAIHQTTALHVWVLERIAP